MGGGSGISRSDVMGDMGYSKFSQRQQAVSVAARLGISGSHSHMMNGDRIFMPGNNHKSLNKALRERGLEETMVPGSGGGGMMDDMGGSGMMSGDMMGGGSKSSGSNPTPGDMMMGMQPDDMMDMNEMEQDMEMEMDAPGMPTMDEVAEADGDGFGVDLGIEMDVPDKDIPHLGSHKEDEDDDDPGGIYG
jgi:hypothetical protein